MCTTDYIKERAQELERAAQAKIDIVDALIPYIITASTRAENLNRPGALLVLLLHMQAELIEEKAAALRVIESALELRRTTTDLAQ